MTHYNGLTPAEQEALSLAMEECGEVVQIIGKIQRHGLESSHPHSFISNRENLAKELGDIECAIQILVRDGVVDRRLIDDHKETKIERFRQRPELLHHVKPP